MINVKLLEKKRKEKGLRMVDVAECLGITVGAYSQKISKKRIFMVRDVVVLSNLFGIGVEEIIITGKVDK